MSGYFGRVLCLLLPMLPTWSALTVTVPSSPIQARPGSDVLLPCTISGSIILDHLAVIWKIGDNTIAKYENQFITQRPGALMTAEQLQVGNASLLLPKVHEGDAGVYTCFVILMPASAEKSLELRIEAPPRLSLEPRALPLFQRGSVTCTASHFYPDTISFTWLRDGKPMEGLRSSPAVLGSDGLYSATSILDLTPSVSDAGAHLSCQVDHIAVRGLLNQSFLLQVQARPILHILTVPQEKNFGAANCLASRFYPKHIRVEWLKNNILLDTLSSQLRNTTDGTYSIQSALFLEESDAEVSYVCRVWHETLDTPLKMTVNWQPKGASSSTGMSFWIGILLFVLGLLLGIAAVILYYKAKLRSDAERKVKRNTSEKSEFESLHDTLSATAPATPRQKSEHILVENEGKDHAMPEAWTENQSDVCVAAL